VQTFPNFQLLICFMVSNFKLFAKFTSFFNIVLKTFVCLNKYNTIIPVSLSISTLVKIICQLRCLYLSLSISFSLLNISLDYLASQEIRSSTFPPMYHNYNVIRSTFKGLTPLKSCKIADQSEKIKI